MSGSWQSLRLVEISTPGYGFKSLFIIPEFRQYFKFNAAELWLFQNRVLIAFPRRKADRPGNQTISKGGLIICAFIRF
jgi:hypothetical protein